jgi:hypothetical protein
MTSRQRTVRPRVEGEHSSVLEPYVVPERGFVDIDAVDYEPVWRLCCRCGWTGPWISSGEDAAVTAWQTHASHGESASRE